MHVKRCLGKDKGTGIRDTRVLNTIKLRSRVRPCSSRCDIVGTGVMEKTVGTDVRLRILGNSNGSTERVDGVGESINSISVVEGLGTKSRVKRLAAL
jgi:hypothetical protein